MAKSSDDAILDALQKAYDALPASLPLSGTKALFAAKQADLAERAVNEGYLAKRDGPPGKGKKPPPVLAVLTEKGVRKVLDARSPKAALEALVPAVQALGRSTPPPSAETFRAELDRATATCVGAIRDAFGELSRTVLAAVAPANGAGVDPGAVLGALKSTLERVEPPAVKAALPSDPAPARPQPDPAVEGEIVSFVEVYARNHTVGCQLDALLNHLRQRHPDLTVGAFHDALRRLHTADRIRLGAWPRMLDDLPEPDLALFVSSKVMYYAHPARR